MRSCFMCVGTSAISVALHMSALEVTVGQLIYLKELKHRKLGWKVLILKYDLGKS